MSGPAYWALVDALSALGRVHVSGDKARAMCPAHDDRAPSLMLRGLSDRVLVRCHAGCSTEQVLAALGWTLGDLYDDPPPTRDPIELIERRRRAAEPKPHPWLVAGGGPIPSVEHLLHRIAQAHGIAEDEPPPDPPWTRTPAPQPPWMPDDEYAAYREWVMTQEQT